VVKVVLVRETLFDSTNSERLPQDMDPLNNSIHYTPNKTLQSDNL